MQVLKNIKWKLFFFLNQENIDPGQFAVLQTSGIYNSKVEI